MSGQWQIVCLYFFLLVCKGAFCQLCVEDIAVDSKLNDKEFVENQLACVMADTEENCDEFGVQIKRLAPDVFKDACIKPCTKCIQKQIRKVIVNLQLTRPKEFSQLVRKFSSQSRGGFRGRRR